MGQFTDVSDGSQVAQCDPLSAVIDIYLGGMNIKASMIQLKNRLISIVGNANDIHDMKLTPVSLP